MFILLIVVFGLLWLLGSVLAPRKGSEKATGTLGDFSLVGGVVCIGLWLASHLPAWIGWGSLLTIPSFLATLLWPRAESPGASMTKGDGGLIISSLLASLTVGAPILEPVQKVQQEWIIEEAKEEARTKARQEAERERLKQEQIMEDAVDRAIMTKVTLSTDRKKAVFPPAPDGKMWAARWNGRAPIQFSPHTVGKGFVLSFDNGEWILQTKQPMDGLVVFFYLGGDAISRVALTPASAPSS